MKTLKDNAFDLAIVDPPYGIAKKLTSGGRQSQHKTIDYSKDWDVAPNDLYFNELFRVSKNWIIWGGNYFSFNIPSARCFIVWRKIQMLGMHTMADCELALTSFDRNAKIYNGNNSSDRIHPTQKPVKLYDWILKNYAKEGDRILDTHLGSGSSAIAAHYGGFDFVGCELDTDYFEAAQARFNDQTRQKAMF